MKDQTAAGVVPPDTDLETLHLRLSLHSALNTIRVEGVHIRYEYMFLRISQRWEGTQDPPELTRLKAKEYIELMHSQGLIQVNSDRYLLTRWGFSVWYRMVEEVWKERQLRAVASEEEMRESYLRRFREGRLRGKQALAKAASMLKQGTKEGA